MAHRATAVVERIYVDRGGVYIRLAIPPSEQPRESYFLLELNHENYYSLYSLAVSAAINRYPLQIRTVGEITPEDFARVEYMVVDW